MFNNVISKIFCLVLISFSSTTLIAQNNKSIILTSSGTGQTKQEAVNNALRSAIEQTYGCFISSQTEILNDEMIKDEVVSLSRGNISNYKIISEVADSKGFFVVVNATVSVSRLTEYAISKGATAELAGATYAQNILIEEMNIKNEKTILSQMYEELNKMDNLYDYKIEVETPKAGANGYVVTVNVLAYNNSNTQAFFDLYLSTLGHLAMDEKTVTKYEDMGLTTEWHTLMFVRRTVYEMGNFTSRPCEICLRNRLSYNKYGLGEELGQILSRYLNAANLRCNGAIIDHLINNKEVILYEKNDFDQYSTPVDRLVKAKTKIPWWPDAKVSNDKFIAKPLNKTTPVGLVRYTLVIPKDQIAVYQHFSIN